MTLPSFFADREKTDVVVKNLTYTGEIVSLALLYMNSFIQ